MSHFVELKCDDDTIRYINFEAVAYFQPFDELPNTKTRIRFVNGDNHDVIVNDTYEAVAEKAFGK